MATLASRGGWGKQVATAFNGLFKGMEQSARRRQSFRGARRFAKTRGRNQRRSYRGRGRGRGRGGRRPARYNTMQAPRTKGFSRAYSNRKQYRFNGTDAAAQIVKPKQDASLPADDSTNSAIINVPLSPTMGSFTPRLATTAALYQHANYNAYDVGYTPQVPTDISGTFYMGFVSDPQSAVHVVSYLDIMMLPVHYYGPIWQPAVLHVRPGMLNKQVPEILLKDEQDTDITDPLQCQGIVVYTVVGLPTDMPEGGVVGNLAVNYDVSFRDTNYKPDATTVGVEGAAVVDGAAGPADHVFTDLFEWSIDDGIRDHIFTVEQDDVAGANFEFKHSRPLRVTVFTTMKTGSGNLPFEMTSATHRFQNLLAIDSATETVRDYIVFGRNPKFNLALSGSGETGTFQVKLLITTVRGDLDTAFYVAP